MARQRTATDTVISHQEFITDGMFPGDFLGTIARNIGRSGLIVANVSTAAIAVWYEAVDATAGPDSYLVAVVYPRGLWEMPEPTFVSGVRIRMYEPGDGVVLVTEL